MRVVLSGADRHASCATDRAAYLCAPDRAGAVALVLVPGLEATVRSTGAGEVGRVRVGLFPAVVLPCGEGGTA